MRAAARELDPDKVRSLMREFRKDARAFYVKYGGGPSIGYDLLDEEGRPYPPAAIVQAALGWNDIKGGLRHSDSAGIALRENGFRVVAKGKFRKNADSTFEKDKSRLLELDETERWVESKQRIHSDVLRKFVLKHRVQCEITGITDVRLLRVSHIVSWSEDATSRLDPDNVILLSALWDAAFDSGLLSFDDAGRTLFGGKLTRSARNELGNSEQSSLAMNDERAAYLARHRQKYDFEK